MVLLLILLDLIKLIPSPSFEYSHDAALWFKPRRRRRLSGKGVLQVLANGARTGDIMSSGMQLLGCRAMGEALIQVLEE